MLDKGLRGLKVKTILNFNIILIYLIQIFHLPTLRFNTLYIGIFFLFSFSFHKRGIYSYQHLSHSEVYYFLWNE